MSEEILDYQGFFDASGQGHDEEGMYVAGFVAPSTQWNRVGEEWRDLLVDHGMPQEFHTSDYIRTKKPLYTHLVDRDDLRDAFEHDVVELMANYKLLPFGHGLVLPDYWDMHRTFILPPHLSTPYSFLATQASISVRNWGVKEAKPVDTIAMVFEDGDKGRDPFAAWFDTAFGIKPNVLRKADSVVLQLADILAWRLMAEMKWVNVVVAGKRGHRRRAFVQILDSLPMNHCGFGDSTTLQSHCDKLGIPRR